MMSPSRPSFERDEIIAAIKRAAQAAGGVSPGWRRFANETGIRYTDWHGRYWTKWSDALVEAGLVPNELNPRIADDSIVRQYAELARELGRLPSFSDIRLRGRTDASMPNDKVFQRFGGKRELVAKVRDWCARNEEFQDVLTLCAHAEPVRTVAEDHSDGPARVAIGYVYLIKSGRYYKIGKSNAVGRREREIALQLPEESKRLHTIETDDPSGIESYWHSRFAPKRKNGEWFALSADDVRAFKRRRFQ
jgi:hypothetical protein